VKILVIHTFGLGDMIMFTPTLEKLFELYPEAEVDFVIFQEAASFPIEKADQINRIYRSSYRIRDLLSILIKLRVQKYDISLVTSGTSAYKAGIFSFLIGAKERIGEYKSWVESLFYTKAIKYIENIHRVENNYKLLCDEEVKHRVKIYGIKKAQRVDKKIRVGIHPGSNPLFKKKRWAKENYVTFINLMQQEYFNIEFYIFSGPSELIEGEYIVQNSSNTLLIEDKSLREVTSLIWSCDIFINSDSGLGHIAACNEDCEIFTIFGPAKDYKVKPYSKKTQVVKLGLDCQPCYGTDRLKKCYDIACLNKLSAQNLFSTLKKYSKVLNNVS